jgi:hypothetical protein
MPASGTTETNNSTGRRNYPADSPTKPAQSISRHGGEPLPADIAQNTEHDLDILWRFILYGFCGVTLEILFTATWELVETGGKNRKLLGISSIYAIVIYGMSSVVIERMYLRLHHLSWYYRGLIYLLWTYAWEFR